MQPLHMPMHTRTYQQAKGSRPCHHVVVQDQVDGVVRPRLFAVQCGALVVTAHTHRVVQHDVEGGERCFAVVQCVHRHRRTCDGCHRQDAADQCPQPMVGEEQRKARGHKDDASKGPAQDDAGHCRGDGHHGLPQHPCSVAHHHGVHGKRAGEKRSGRVEHASRRGEEGEGERAGDGAESCSNSAVEVRLASGARGS